MLVLTPENSADIKIGRGLLSRLLSGLEAGNLNRENVRELYLDPDGTNPPSIIMACLEGFIHERVASDQLRDFLSDFRDRRDLLAEWGKSYRETLGEYERWCSSPEGRADKRSKRLELLRQLRLENDNESSQS